ncbi:hypothetical protein ONS95_003001 [Cadophora gregata]|uniref:uncharacterized protein n=1 Tax=Cadophora gregata TaxID=51156 RepID=UPI0026DAC83F|nr:uncharacterized protein ONS95_003001 [Cadophora gregata]KAK0108178.1 hypothetical protein ONS95_003001 [Cadophora gregata]KAK0109229.1 hypothetical protein ONS96_003050 [Cadophora gregata f. sp. sojae]
MGSQSNYQRGGNRSFPSLASISSMDQGQMYTREMGPPSSDFPPQPVEIDLNSSRTLPNPSVPASMQWELLSSPGYGDVSSYGGSNIPRMSTMPNDVQSRGPSDNPLINWYSANDGPWAPFPKGPESATDERLLLKQANNRNVSYSGQYRHQNQSDASNFHFGVPHSDSGYGTRRSVGNTSVFSADVHDRDQDSHSMVGPSQDFSSFAHGYHEVLQQRDSRTSGTWSPPTSHSVESPGLVCPTCHKQVKTQSELKKHDLRHRKPYVCGVPGCPRTQGFSTTNDLDRHTKSKHPSAIPENAPTKKYRCLVPGCKSKDKAWPRLDNFRSHLRRVHENFTSFEENLDEIIRRAEFWERSGIISEPEVTNHQLPIPEESRPAHSGHGGLPRQTGQYPDIMDRIQDYSPQHGPQSASFDSTASSPEEKSPQSEESLPTTVQPVEVFPPPAQIPERRMTLNDLLSTNLDPSLKASEQARSSLSAKVSPQGKAARQTVPATDATLTKVIQKALAAVNDAPTEPFRNQESERTSLPTQKVAPREYSSANPDAATLITKASPMKLADTPSEDTSKDDEAQKKASEVLKIIRKLGFTVSKDPTQAPKVQNPGSVASNKSEHQVTCPICQKFTGRPCELKKHMKRHERPYGCTFPTCNKDFGSKNDWKRHENSQHFHLEIWRCDTERPEGGTCAKVCYRRQTFQDHLKKEHQISEPEDVKKKIDDCRIGRNCQSRFWCGFCKKLVDLKKKGLDAWTERFDHIDDHFMGRAPFPKQGIQDWVPVDSDKPKGDVLVPSPLGSGAGSPPNGHAGSPSGSEGQSSTSPIHIHENSNTLKRRATDEAEGAKPPKQASFYKDYEARVYCVSSLLTYSLTPLLLHPRILN